jgi:hypothetical protein
MNILKEIQSNNMLKVIIVLAGVYLFMVYNKEDMGNLMYGMEGAENVSMLAPSPAAPKKTLEQVRAELEQVRAESEQRMSAAEMAQPIIQGPTSSGQAGSAPQQQQQAGFQRVVDGVPPLAAEDLLPKYDDADKFAKENPISKLLKEQNFLISGYHVGINTVVQSNKIAYHDLRSAPPIPKESVGPWSQSSYDTPMGANRRQLEIS